MAQQSSLPGISVADHSNLGRDWENQLAATHEWYRRQRWADIVKNPSEWKYTGAKEYNSRRLAEPAMVAATGDGLYMIRVPSDVDYSGGGRGFGKHFSICFDAKTSKQLPVPLKMFKGHQIARVMESARCGSLAGFLLRLSSLDRVFWLPHRVIYFKETVYLKSRAGRRAKAGTASLTLGELESNCPEVKKCPANGLWDYLKVLLEE